MSRAYIYIGWNRERRGAVGHMVGEHFDDEGKFFIEEYEAMGAYEESRRDWAELAEEEYAEFERIINAGPGPLLDAEAANEWGAMTVAKKRWIQRRNRLQRKEAI